MHKNCLRQDPGEDPPQGGLVPAGGPPFQELFAGLVMTVLNRVLQNTVKAVYETDVRVRSEKTRFSITGRLRRVVDFPGN